MTAREVQEKIRNNPDWFVEKFLGYKLWKGVEQKFTVGERLYWRGQIEILESVRDYERTSVIGCTGSTKSFAAAITICWMMGAYQIGRVFTVAPSYRQVEMNLWGYINKLHSEALIPLGGRLMSRAMWQISKDTYVQGFSVKQPENVAGIHGKNDLLVLDDAHAIPKLVIDAMERAMAGRTCKLLMLANPMVVMGEVYDSFNKNKSLYNCISIPAWKVPNYLVEEHHEKLVSKKLEKISGKPSPSVSEDSKSKISPKILFPFPGAIIKSKCDEWRTKYGPDSNFYRVMVESKFPLQQSDTLIPLDWIQQAIQRETSPQAKFDKHMILGVDVARFGDDRTIIAPLRGRQILPLLEYRKFDTQQVAQQVHIAIQNYAARAAAVDSIGIGAGVVDRLHALGDPVIPINVGFTNLPELFDPETGKRTFSSLRSKVWWTLREALDPSNPHAIILPNDLDLIAELSCIKYSLPDGIITIQSKEDMKRPENLGYSPDKADAIALAIYGQSHRDFWQSALPLSVVALTDDEENDSNSSNTLQGVYGNA